MIVAHVISGLELGGAETALFNLVRSLHPRVRQEVVSMTTEGVLGERIRRLGVPLRALRLGRGLQLLGALPAMVRGLREADADLVQTWMYHADLFGGLAGRLAGVPVVWGIHHTTLERGSARATTRLIARLNGLLSPVVPRRIVVCAEAAQRVHARLGYDARRMTVIPNGFDVDQFRPDPSARQAARAGLGIASQAPLIGMVARFHPQKDHHTFLQAAGRLHQQLPEAGSCNGSGIGEQRQLSWIDEQGLREMVRLLGPRPDLAKLYPALDVFCLSSSHGEGLPMVLGEAIACEVPCVTTDVGDSASIVGEAGIAVPPRSPEPLAAALLRVARMDPEARLRLGRAARQRIATEFRVEIMAERYLRVYEEVAGVSQPGAEPGPG
jgi:glycosyltransferase involved in cell wall biosynthesis